MTIDESIVEQIRARRAARPQMPEVTAGRDRCRGRSARQSARHGAGPFIDHVVVILPPGPPRASRCSTVAPTAADAPARIASTGRRSSSPGSANRTRALAQPIYALADGTAGPDDDLVDGAGGPDSQTNRREARRSIARAKLTGWSRRSRLQHRRTDDGRGRRRSEGAASRLPPRPADGCFA
jgi:hypothetical protein